MFLRITQRDDLRAGEVGTRGRCMPSGHAGPCCRTSDASGAQLVCHAAGRQMRTWAAAGPCCR
eukprot:1542915-Prymnesium_polylepis.1